LKQQLELVIFDAFVNGAAHLQLLIRIFLPVAAPELI
jgi:ABC-type maltose transport system permease subunit